MKIRSFSLALAGFAFLATILFVRTTGIHVDEAGYLSVADDARTGDSLSTGKPPLFYWLNYKFYNEIGPWFGPFKPVSLYFLYMAVFVWALIWALKPFFEDRTFRLSLTFFVLLLSPLALLNATQMMMETAMLPFVSLMFGSVVRGSDTAWKCLRLLLFSAALVALKVTGAPVVVLIAAGAFRRSPSAAALLGAGAVLGFLGNKAAVRWVVQAQHADNYGGLAEILNRVAVLERLRMINEDLYVWLFFSGIAVIVAAAACAYNWWRPQGGAEGKRLMSDATLMMLAAGSLVLMLFMQTISIHGFPRYNYPTLWLGLVSAVILAARQRAVAVLSLAIVFGLQSSSLWGSDLDRFHLWPSRTVLEFFQSGGTTLMGAPVHRLAVEQHFRDSSPCYALESIHPDEQKFYARYFEFAFPKGRPRDSSEPCATTIHVWRDPVDTVGSCPARCEPSSRRNICGYQRLVFFTAHQGLALNQVCW